MNFKANRLLKTLAYSQKRPFTSLVKGKYPYVFGGIDVQSTNPALNYFFQQVFGKNVLQGFREAYLATLSGLRDKDAQFLKQIMERNLTKDIQFQDVDLVQQDGIVQVKVGNIFVTIGASFDRTPENSKWIFIKKQQPFQLMISPVTSLSLPLLLGAEVYFHGVPKLIRKGQTIKPDVRENHMIQFQICNPSLEFSSFELLQKMKPESGMTNFQSAKSFISALFGGQYEWKIGDMDRVLQRNFTVSDNKGIWGKFF